MKRTITAYAMGLLLLAGSADTKPVQDTPELMLNAFSGRFFGTLPDASCSALDVMLMLSADGRYALQGHCQENFEEYAIDRGTWSITWNGTCVQLAPHDNASPVREFAIHDDNLLVLTEGSCIEPVDDPRGRSLRRAHDAPQEE